MGLFKKQDLIGLDIGTNSLKVAQLKRNSRGYELIRAGIKPLPPGTISEDEVLDRKAIIEAIKQLLREQKITTRQVATSVSGRSVIVKRIKLPEMDEEELMETILYEAEQYIPFDINDVNLDFQIMNNAKSKGEGQMDILLVAVKKERIQDIVSLIYEAGLIPAVVDIDVFALENQYEINYPRDMEHYVVLLDIGADTMNMNILWEGETIFTRDASLGGNNYFNVLQNNLGLGVDQIEKLKSGEIPRGLSEDQLTQLQESFYEEILSEIQRSFDYFRATADDVPIAKILLSGGTSKIGKIEQVLAQRFELEVEKGNAFQNIHVNPSQFDSNWIAEVAPIMGVVIGLALRKVDDR